MFLIVARFSLFDGKEIPVYLKPDVRNICGIVKFLNIPDGCECC
jgi:hypothetical protein